MTEEKTALIGNFLDFSFLAVFGLVWFVLRVSDAVKRNNVEKSYQKVIENDDDSLLADTFNKLR